MIISEKQLQLLLQTLNDSIPFVNYFTLDKEARIRLYEQILNQQSEELKEID
jgi:hypothetical protein